MDLDRLLSSHDIPDDVKQSIRQALGVGEQDHGTLLASHGRLLTLLQHMPVMLGAFDADGTVVFWNSECERVTGYSAEEIVGNPRAFELLYPDADYREEMLASWRGREGDCLAHETKLTCKQGIVKTVYWSSISRSTPIEGWAEWAVGIDVTERETARRDLAASEERYRSLFNSPLNGFAVHEIILDDQGAPVDYRFLAINDAFERLTGLNRDAVVGRTVSEVIPEIEPVWAERYGQVALTGEPIEFEQYAAPLGRHYHVSAFRPAEGQFACVFVDITERKRAEERYRRLVETMNDGVWQVDGEGNTELVNPSMARMLGYTVEEMVGRVFQSFLVPEEQERLDANADRREQGIAESYETTLVRNDGSRVPVRVSATPVWDDATGFAGSFAVMTDITDAKQAEADLRRERDRAQQYLDTANVTMLVLDAEGKVELVNSKGCEVLRHTADQLVGKDWFDTCIPEADRESVREVFDRLMAGEIDPVALGYYENAVVTAGGGIRQTSWHNTVIRDDAGNIIGTLSSGDDITERLRAEEERRRLEAQVQQMQRLDSLGVLASGVAHEFNSLLTAVIGNAALALEHLPADSPARQSVEQIEAAAIRAAELARQMLAYSGGGKFVMEPIDLSELVAEVVAETEASVGPSVELRVETADAIPPIGGDANQIRQALGNLIANAAEAIGDAPGLIMVCTSSEVLDRESLAGTYIDDGLPAGRYVCVSVSDDGPGMDAETRERAFEPFFSTRFVGRGLGLAAVLGIVRSHAGAIAIQSKPGEGTTVSIYLPASAMPGSTPRSTQPREVPHSGSATILVVDDEEAVREVAQRVLEGAGYRVLLACDGRTAVEVFAAHADEIMLCLIDVSMPDLDGREACREIVKVRADVPVLLTSGYAEDAAGEACCEALVGFLPKPFTPAALVERIREALTEHP